MSYTSVYELYKTKVKRISELHNGHGSGPAIWNYISIKLTGKDFNYFDSDSFWPLYKDGRLSDHEKAVLLSTYDNSYIEVEKLNHFSIAAKKIHDLIINQTEWTWNHFKNIGDVAEKLASNHDRRCKGLCIGCTSVSDPWEHVDAKTIDAWGVYQLIESINNK